MPYPVTFSPFSFGFARFAFWALPREQFFPQEDTVRWEAAAQQPQQLRHRGERARVAAEDEKKERTERRKNTMWRASRAAFSIIRSLSEVFPIHVDFKLNICPEVIMKLGYKAAYALQEV